MSALALRIIACAAMLIDHIGYCLYGVIGNDSIDLILRLIGRIAFPIFVFLIVNGYRHTSSKPKYALRLLIFALISQQPFTYMEGIGLFTKGNVFFTLLIALCVIWATDVLVKKKETRFMSPLPAIVVFILYYFGIIKSDYGLKGTLIALVFFFLYDKKILCAVGMFVSVFYSTFISFGLFVFSLIINRPRAFAVPDLWEICQAASMFALIPIFLYNGKKGTTPKNTFAAKSLQIGFYAFYPVHILILTVIADMIGR